MEPSLDMTGVGDKTSAKLNSPLVHYKMHSANCAGTSAHAQNCAWRWRHMDEQDPLALSHTGLGRGHR